MRLEKHQHRGRRASLGYTVVEVMMALAVLSVGATGIIAMQKAAIVGNLRARNQATANAIAAGWVERLRVDARRWKVLENGQSTITQTTYLNVVGDDFPTIGGGEGAWFRPIPSGTHSPQADVHGVDTATAADAGFCTHLRLTQVLPNLIRAEIRVFWLREQGQGTINGEPLCSSNAGYIAALDLPTADTRYHFMQLVTGIIRTDE